MREVRRARDRGRREGKEGEGKETKREMGSKRV